MRRSLRVRLLAIAAAAIFAALTAAWFAMSFLFERHIERRVALELEREGRQLVADVSLDAKRLPHLERLPTDSRFDEPASGVYWQISSEAGDLRSRSLWDQSLQVSNEAGTREWSTRIAAGPFGRELLVVERVVQPDPGGASVLVQLAHEIESLRGARAEFALELALFLALLWLILTGAAWVQVDLGLKPLVRVRDELRSLKRNPHKRLSNEHPREIEPLSSAINDLADARERDLDRARRRAADLAHALKTPLAALAAQSRRAREHGALEAADGLDRAIAAASAAVESELSRSRAAAIVGTPRDSPVNARDAIESVVAVIERTEAGAHVVFEIDVPDLLPLPIAREDLIELTGAIIENAARYARRRVFIGCEVSSREAALRIEDDGPGIEAESVARALARGARLDEVGSGHGLGLAIARDLAEATGGAILLDRSDLGGLLVLMKWPTTEAALDEQAAGDIAGEAGER